MLEDEIVKYLLLKKNMSQTELTYETCGRVIRL
jgi:hypothetical protein